MLCNGADSRNCAYILGAKFGQGTVKIDYIGSMLYMSCHEGYNCLFRAWCGDTH